jgi:hypothetical protein
MRANPGGYIPPHEVIGRDRFIERLWEILERQSLVLTAERRMGKTSIIRKMEAEAPADKLAVFHELENVNTPLMFVQLVFDDVSQYLSRSSRTAQRVLDFLRSLGGVEIGGVIKLPDNLASEWEPILTKAIEDLVEHQERTLIFLWDELPIMLDNIKRHHGEKVAEQVLNTLRSLRQMHPGLRMVYTGSIGLHHVITSLKRSGYANAPTNDMYKVDVPPLSPQDGQELAQQLLQGEAIQTEGMAQLAQDIANAVDNCPYYIHHIVDELKHRGPDPPIAELVNGRLTASNDPWDLRHYYDRIRTYYTSGEQPFALDLLDILAEAEQPLAFDELFNRLKAHQATEDRETVRHVLRLLHDDHYLTRHADGTFQLRFSLIQRWWRLERGLAS